MLRLQSIILVPSIWCLGKVAVTPIGNMIPTHGVPERLSGLAAMMCITKRLNLGSIPQMCLISHSSMADSFECSPNLEHGMRYGAVESQIIIT